MAQHDYVIDNSTGATVRADINNVLQAIATNNSGSSAPSTTHPFQLFADTTNNVLKIRNAANNGFINLFTLSGGVDVDAASNFNEDVTFTGASANIVFDKSENTLEFKDDAFLAFGDNDECTITHQSSDSTTRIIETGGGSLFIQAGNFVVTNPAGSEFMINGAPDGALNLYHNGLKKAETAGGGFTVTGTCTATAFSGDGSGLTGVGSTTINNNANNRVITGSGTANTLEAESGLTYDGQQFRVETVTSESNALRLFNTTTSGTVYQINGEGNSFVGHTYPRSDANLDLGFASGNRWRDVILSGGIRFGTANSSDYLDDYEEGTFTPQFAGVGGGPTSITFGTTNGGSYVKVGNLVYVAGRSDITASSGGSQHWFITNMPFVNKSGTKQFNSVGHLALENFSVPDNVIDLVASLEQGINNMIFTGTRKDNTLTNGISHGADQVYSVTFAICYRTD